MNHLLSAPVFLPIISLFKDFLTLQGNNPHSISSRAIYHLIIWDFGDTLDRLSDAALAKGASAIERETGRLVSKEMLRRAIRHEWRNRSDRASLDVIKAIDTNEKEDDYYREFYRCVVDRFSDPAPSESLLDALIDMQVSPDSYELMPGALEVLGKLKEKGIPQAILSNGFRSTREHIKHLKIEDYFDCIMISCEERAAKPDHELYQRLLDSCNIKNPQKTLFIDDRREFIEGALQLHMDALWFQPQDNNENGWQGEKISSLNQVYEKVVEKEQEHDCFFQPCYPGVREAFS